MDRYIVALIFKYGPWVLGLIGLIGILWRLGRIATLLEQIRDQQPTTTGPREKVRIPGLND